MEVATARRLWFYLATLLYLGAVSAELYGLYIGYNLLYVFSGLYVVTSLYFDLLEKYFRIFGIPRVSRLVLALLGFAIGSILLATGGLLGYMITSFAFAVGNLGWFLSQLKKR